MLINVFEREFIILGVPIWPQDFHIVALGLISFVVFIVLFTVIYGRVWCGWACPQTIFMEMVFRKIEYWIEGDATQQKRLNDAPWSTNKVFKKVLKHGIFILFSLLISHTVMAYLIGIEQVKEIISQPPTEHLAGFIGLMAFTFIFYFVFSFFREQVCIAVCPYGRLQGVFLGNSSIAVMYDWLRGEKRGRLKKGQKTEENQGDCIDCKMCVYACPTGIDIRNGTQLECVNCTACMDACDAVMEKVGFPKRLIKYASHNGIQDGKSKIFTTRVAGYSIVLLSLLSLIFFMLLTRPAIEATILKVPGQLYQEQPNNRISNLYNIQFINKTYQEADVNLVVKDIDDAEITRVGEEDLIIPASGTVDGVFFIEIPRSALTEMKMRLIVQIINNGEVVDEVKTNFMGPLAFGR
jgi:cytochrome c oxidase accessory protein FixG